MRSAAKRASGAGCARVAMVAREAASATARQSARRRTGGIFMVAYPIRRRIFDPAGGRRTCRRATWHRHPCPMPLSLDTGDHSAPMVGRTPWSAADALVGLPRWRKGLILRAKSGTKASWPRGHPDEGVRPTNPAAFHLLGLN